jgi:hypothetical protein
VDVEIHLLAIQMAIHLDLKVYILVQDQTMDVDQLLLSSPSHILIVCLKLGKMDKIENMM